MANNLATGKAGPTKASTRKGKPHESAQVEAAHFLKHYELLIQIGGTLQDVAVVFGKPGELQMQFKPLPDGTMTVFHTSPVGDDGLRAYLGKGRSLWDAKENRPCAEFLAIEEATILKDQLAAAPAGGPDVCYPSVVLPVLSNLIEAILENPDRLKLAAKAYKEFSSEPKQGLFFRSSTESCDVRDLRENAVLLAQKWQRPPARRELSDAVGWTKRSTGADDKAFRKALHSAGLAWLPDPRLLPKKPGTR